MRLGFALGAVALALLAACDEPTADVALNTGTGPAQTACVAAVARNYSADSGATITSSEFSEAGSLVMLRTADGSTWRCLASNDGIVEELTAS